MNNGLVQMKIYFSIILFSSLLSLSNTTNAQISGYVKNNAGQGLEGKVVEVYQHFNNNNQPIFWADVTDATGRFAADPWTTDIDDEILPEDYKLDAPYPNPFNPSTTITVPVKEQGEYELILINSIGQQIATMNKELNPGLHRFNIQQPGAAGIYLYMFSRNQKMISSGKLAYIGGGAKAADIISHKDERSLPLSLQKITTGATLDSIRVRGDAIQTKTFPFGIDVGQAPYDVGTLIVDSAFVNINGRIYKLFDWKEPNNGIKGATVKIGTREAITDMNGNYVIQAPTGIQVMEISHPNIWTRKTKIIAYNSATLPDMNVMDKTRMPENNLAFYDTVASRANEPSIQNILERFYKTNMQFYIQANTNDVKEKIFKDWQILKIESVLRPVLYTPMYPQGFLTGATIA